MVAFYHEPDGESHQSASNRHFEAFAKKTSPGSCMFRVLPGKILHVLHEIARSGALLGAAQGRMGAFASPKVPPLKKFVNHDQISLCSIYCDERFRQGQTNPFAD